jgi:Tol biopolymer transport system component
MFGKSSIIFWGGILLGLLVILNINNASAQVPMASFLSDRSGEDEVHVVYDDGEIKQVTDHKVKTLTPDWSPDGKYIVYAANIRGGENFDLRYVDMADPANPKDKDLTGKELGVKLNEPVFAPQGDPRILVYAQTLPQGASWDVGFLTLDQGIKPGNLVNITNAEGEGVNKDQKGSWSPDGTKIVFESNRDLIDNKSQFDIFISNADGRGAGNEQVNLTNHVAPDEWARFSPDGMQIIFQSKRDGNSEIYVMDTDGNNLIRLTNHEKTDRRAEWSSTDIIAFETQRDGNWEIYRMDPDGNNKINLTNDPKGDNGVVWSPKGRKMLFESKRDGKREVYVMDANGGDLRNLSNNPGGNDTYPRWNPQFELRLVEPRQKRFTTLGEVKRSALSKN